MTIIDIAREYLRRGWQPIPVPFRKKAPVGKGWERLRLTEADLLAHFNGQQQNIGILLGEPSGGLYDIDLDCPEALRLSDCFLPKTGAVFGRNGKQWSHRLLLCDGDHRTKQFEDIRAPGEKPVMLLELRGTGGQTVFPGSVHETGEPIEWSTAGEPARIDYSELHTAACKLAAMALIARHWPNKGCRHNAANALAGALYNCGQFDRDRIPERVGQVAECAGDDEVEAREKAAALTVEKAGKGEHITGRPTLAEIIGEKVVNRAMEWLGVSRSSKANAAGATTAPKVRPQPRQIEPYISFPVDVLPQPIRGFVCSSASALGVDESFVALPLLAALASAIGNTRRIQLKRNWREPSILWCVIVGESGTLKSPAMELALQAIRRVQDEALKRYAEARAGYDRAMVTYEANLTAWKNKPIGEQPQKPDKPAAARYVVSDVTIEALATILQENPHGILLARDELSGWLRSHNQYRKGHGGDTAHWLEMFHGRPMLVDRKTGENRIIHVPRAAVSICGGIQPGTLASALTPEYFDCGVAARLLLAMPPRKPKRWTDAEIPVAVEADLALVVERLLTLQPSPGEGEGEGPRPVDVTLSDDGREAWVRFYNEHAAEQNELAGDLAAAWSKLEGCAARLALVAHFVRWAAPYPPVRNPNAIDAESVNAGVALARWFGNEARRVYSVLGESDEDRERRRLVELIERKGGIVTPRELTRSSRLYRKVEDAEAALEGLIEAGLGRWEYTTTAREGGRPSRFFRLVESADETPENPPELTPCADDTPSHDPASEGFGNVGAVNAAQVQPDDPTPPPEFYDTIDTDGPNSPDDLDRDQEVDQ